MNEIPINDELLGCVDDGLFGDVVAGVELELVGDDVHERVEQLLLELLLFDFMLGRPFLLLPPSLPLPPPLPPPPPIQINKL